MGAIATGGTKVLNPEVVEAWGIADDAIDAVAAREEKELERRERLYRGGRPPPEVRGRVVILVDDGLATGSTMRAAVAALQQQEPARVVVAVPTAAASTVRRLESEVDEVVSAMTPEPFHAVGLWYEDFSQTSDTEIKGLLERARRPASSG